MKKVYQNHLRKMLIAIYQPVITRIELIRSTRMWQKGVKATLAKYQEGGRLASTCSTTSPTRIGPS